MDAIAVAKAAIEEGLANVPLDTPIETLVNQHLWEPHYLLNAIASTRVKMINHCVNLLREGTLCGHAVEQTR